MMRKMIDLLGGSAPPPADPVATDIQAPPDPNDSPPPLPPPAGAGQQAEQSPTPVVPNALSLPAFYFNIQAAPPANIWPPPSPFPVQVPNNLRWPPPIPPAGQQSQPPQPPQQPGPAQPVYTPVAMVGLREHSPPTQDQPAEHSPPMQDQLDKHSPPTSSPDRTANPNTSNSSVEQFEALSAHELETAILKSIRSLELFVHEPEAESEYHADLNVREDKRTKQAKDLFAKWKASNPHYDKTGHAHPRRSPPDTKAALAQMTLYLCTQRPAELPPSLTEVHWTRTPAHAVFAAWPDRGGQPVFVYDMLIAALVEHVEVESSSDAENNGRSAAGHEDDGSISPSPARLLDFTAGHSANAEGAEGADAGDSPEPSHPSTLNLDSSDSDGISNNGSQDLDYPEPRRATCDPPPVAIPLPAPLPRRASASAYDVDSDSDSDTYLGALGARPHPRRATTALTVEHEYMSDATAGKSPDPDLPIENFHDEQQGEIEASFAATTMAYYLTESEPDKDEDAKADEDANSDADSEGDTDPEADVESNADAVQHIVGDRQEGVKPDGDEHIDEEEEEGHQESGLFNGNDDPMFDGNSDAPMDMLGGHSEDRRERSGGGGAETIDDDDIGDGAEDTGDDNSALVLRRAASRKRPTATSRLRKQSNVSKPAYPQTRRRTTQNIAKQSDVSKVASAQRRRRTTQPHNRKLPSEADDSEGLDLGERSDDDEGDACSYQDGRPKQLSAQKVGSNLWAMKDLVLECRAADEANGAFLANHARMADRMCHLHEIAAEAADDGYTDGDLLMILESTPTTALIAAAAAPLFWLIQTNRTPMPSMPRWQDKVRPRTSKKGKAKATLIGQDKSKGKGKGKGKAAPRPER